MTTRALEKVRAPERVHARSTLGQGSAMMGTRVAEDAASRLLAMLYGAQCCLRDVCRKALGDGRNPQQEVLVAPAGQKAQRGVCMKLLPVDAGNRRTIGYMRARARPQITSSRVGISPLWEPTKHFESLAKFRCSAREMAALAAPTMHSRARRPRQGQEQAEMQTTNACSRSRSLSCVCVCVCSFYVWRGLRHDNMCERRLSSRPPHPRGRTPHTCPRCTLPSSGLRSPPRAWRHGPRSSSLCRCMRASTPTTP